MKDAGSTGLEDDRRAYDATTIALHWAVAVLAALAWLSGLFLDSPARAADRDTLRSVHAVIGSGFGLLLVLRMAWRLYGGVRLPPPAPGTRGQVAISVHRLLYLLLAAAAALGLVLAWVRGDPVFGLSLFPGFDPGHRALRRELAGLHALAAHGLMLAAALHAAAAMANGYLRRNTVLERMRPASWRRGGPPG